MHTQDAPYNLIARAIPAQVLVEKFKARKFQTRRLTYSTRIMKTKRFPKNILETIRDEKILGIRAGIKPHRVIGIWAVVVEGRIFVRSWSMKPRSWYRTFLEEPTGIVVVSGREFPIRAVNTRSERIKDAVSRAYREKYNTPGSLDFVKGFAVKKRRDTTTELVPL